MIWALYWYALAAWNVWQFSVEHEQERLFYAVIFVVIGTGQRIVRTIEKSKT